MTARSLPAPEAPFAAPVDEGALEERLSRPDDRVISALRECPGDVVVLGAGGKMGPSLASMIRRASDALGRGRRVIAVARWSSPAARARLESAGVATQVCDLEDGAAVAALPDAPNIVFMAGQKFGTSAAPERMRALNTVMPAIVATRYATSRIVAFSTGNVYALSPVGGPHAQEADALAPVGDYAASCVGRERAFETASAVRGTPVAIVRLNYAVDLRYGVLVDIARRVHAGETIDLTMGWVNVIWQGDANAYAIRLLAHAAAPPFVCNVTGTERLSVRELAEHFGARFGVAPQFSGEPASDALLSDTTRLRTVLGAPSVTAGLLIEWVAGWIERRMPLLGKPTQFERRDGRF